MRIEAWLDRRQASHIYSALNLLRSIVLTEVQKENSALQRHIVGKRRSVLIAISNHWIFFFGITLKLDKHRNFLAFVKQATSVFVSKLSWLCFR